MHSNLLHVDRENEPKPSGGRTFMNPLVNNSAAHDSRSGVSLMGVEFVDVGRGELAGRSLLFEQDVEFSVGSALGFRQTEPDPDGL